jgi:hypothetical protein
MSFSQPVTEIIRQRFSCRTYDGRPIADEQRQLLETYLTSSGQGPFGTQPRFKLVAATADDESALKGLGTYGFIRGATGFVIGAMKDGAGNLEDFGYLLERIILYATDLGLGTCWLGGTFTKSRFARRISATRQESVPAAVSTGYVAERQTFADSMSRQVSRGDHRLPWARLFWKAQSGAPLAEGEAGPYAEPLEMVRLGPSASNKQPWRIAKDGDTWHFYLQRTPGYREGALKRIVGIADMQRIDMGIAMCHFELSARELGLAGRWAVSEPGIPAGDRLGEYTVSWVDTTQSSGV